MSASPRDGGNGRIRARSLIERLPEEHFSFSFPPACSEAPSTLPATKTFTARICAFDAPEPQP